MCSSKSERSDYIVSRSSLRDRVQRPRDSERIEQRRSNRSVPVLSTEFGLDLGANDRKVACAPASSSNALNLEKRYLHCFVDAMSWFLGQEDQATLQLLELQIYWSDDSTARIWRYLFSLCWSSGFGFIRKVISGRGLSDSKS